MSDNNTVDRVAKALYAHETGSTDGWDGPLLQERGRDMWRKQARSAIAAMPAPTELMADIIEKHFLEDGKWELDENKDPPDHIIPGRWLWLSDANYGFRPVDLVGKIVAATSG